MPRKLATFLSGHDSKTVSEMGWSGKKNGVLLNLAQHSFDVFLTVDQNLQFQQNITQFKIGIVVISAKTNRLADLQPLVPKILSAISTNQSGRVIVIAGK